MSGASFATLRRACLAIACVIVAIDVVDVFTVLGDSARYGMPLPVWEPVVWEATSGVAMLLVCGIVYRALRMAEPGRAPWLSALVMHGSASLLFSVGHVAIMTMARSAVYAAVGLHYRIALADWPYEYRKDILAYILIGGVFWTFGRYGDAGRDRPAPPARPATFDITDGANLVRLTMSDIAAIQAAGNYVEFMLIDGRRHLMRGSIGQMADRFAGDGFVRTHRSWLVNGAKITAITATGSGDSRSCSTGSSARPCRGATPPRCARSARG